MEPSHGVIRIDAIRRRLARASVVVVPPQEIDVASAPELGERLSAIGESTDVVVDLRNVTFCDSTAIALLITAERELAARDCSLTLTGPAPQFERLLRLCGLEDHFAIRRPTDRR